MKTQTQMLRTNNEFSLSFSFDDFRIEGVIDNNVYLIGEKYDETDISECIVIIEKALLRKALSLWIRDKKYICDLYGHFCGAMGRIYADEYKVHKRIAVYDDSKASNTSLMNRFPTRETTTKLETFEILSIEDSTDMEHG